MSELTTWDNRPRFMKNQYGKFVGIREVDDQLRLCAFEHQGSNAPSVTIKEKSESSTDGFTQMALRFKYGSTPYFLKVNGNSLELERVDQNNLSNTPDGCWFKRENEVSGDFYLLQPTGKPGYFLYVTKERNFDVFSLSDQKSNGALVTDEERK